MKPSSKIVITVFSGLLVLSTYFIVNTYFTSLHDSEEGALKRLEAIAKTLAIQIDGDQHEIITERYPEPGVLSSNEEDSLYFELWKPMRETFDKNELGIEISTLVLRSDNSFDYILNSSDTPYLADPYIEHPPEFLELYKTGGVIHQYTDEYGTWLTAIAPIKNQSGEVVAIVEIDQQFDVFIAAARSKMMTNLLVSFGIFVLIGFIVLRMVKQIVRAEEESKRIIQESNEIITQKNRDILDSINYAQRIQNAILAPKEEVFSDFTNAFILYKPKDIVSGDFYYFSRVGDRSIIAAADCTGHGVPGALMSMIGNDLLNHVTKERKVSNPGEILDMLHKGIINVLKQDGKFNKTRDGMDIALLSFNHEKSELQFAGAYRPLIIVRDGELIQVKADKYPIGNASQERDKFTSHNIELRKGDMCYIFTDGYADQFGGAKGKKFMAKKFYKLLVATAKETVAKQEEKLNNEIENWRGDNEQVDDILVIGIKIA